MPRFTSRTLVALAFTLVVWASAFAGIRAGLRAYSPANLAIVRFLVASLVLAIYAAIAGARDLCRDRALSPSTMARHSRAGPGRRYRNYLLQSRPELRRDSRDRGRSQSADCLHSDLDRAGSPILAARETNRDRMVWSVRELRGSRADRQRRRRRHPPLAAGADRSCSGSYVRALHDYAEALSGQ